VERPPDEVFEPIEEAARISQAAARYDGRTRLLFYFDPICPWAWRTARWVSEARRGMPVDVHWRLFSLATLNGRRDDTQMIPARALELLRESAGNEAVEKAYLTLGCLIHEEHRDILNRKGMESVVAEALDRAGFDRTLVTRALGDPVTEQQVLRGHDEARNQYGAYGVPWLVVGNCNFGFQGPVLEPPPTGELAVELWRHVSWLLAQPYFYELKRAR
jgi:predicted DsbA family dithiol-disulfide isomerase